MISRVPVTKRPERDKPDQKQNKKTEKKKGPSFGQVLEKESQKESNKTP